VRATARADLLRPWSLLWLIPERAARWLAWLLVIFACFLPLVLLAASTLSRSPAKERESLQRLLSERLGVPVTLRLDRREAGGQYHLSDVRIAGRGLTLQAASATWCTPREGVPGRLDLDRGRLVLDLECFTGRPSRTVAGMLLSVREHADLRSLTLSNFASELRFGKSAVALPESVGRAELTEEGGIEGRLAGRAGAGRVSLSFHLTDDSQRVVLAGKPLPWVKELLAPTLGATLPQLLDAPQGELTLAGSPLTGSESGEGWELRFRAPLDLGGIPRQWGLGGITGRIDLEVHAFGPRGGAATLTARLSLPEGASAAADDPALRSLRYLLTGRWTPAAAEDTTHSLRALDLSVIVTREHIYLTSTPDALRTGVFAADGTELLGVPLGEAVPIGEFVRRLEALGRLWAEAHAS
jgi:hypothetical protein